MKKLVLFIAVGLCLAFLSFSLFIPVDKIDEKRILSHVVNLKKQHVKLYWKDKNGKLYRNFKNLKKDLATNKEELIFAMNGGMYMKNRTPLGLYIENGKTLKRINRVKKAHGNFYLQPNGIFYITKSKKGYVCKTTDYKDNGQINFATQSGPMLVIDGKIHSKFSKGSKNLNVRNGVGVLPNGDLLFGISKSVINLYDFASYFKQKGCKNALYLDGFVSRTYLKSKGMNELGGNFGVIIGEVKKND